MKSAWLLPTIFTVLVFDCGGHVTEEEAMNEIFGDDDAEHQKHDEHMPVYAWGWLFGLNAEELQFNMFNIHDLDKNGLLDGLEMLNAIHHNNYTAHAINHGKSDANGHHLEDDAEIVDVVLRDDDLNNDGFLDYSEFSVAKKKNPKNKVYKHI